MSELDLNAIGQRMNAAYCNANALIAELRRLREGNRWIPVVERLPEKGRRYLVFDGQTVRMADYQDGYDRFVATDGRSGFGVLDPSHWRPLPAPPEVK